MGNYGSRKHDPKPKKENPEKKQRDTRSKGEDVTKETHCLKNMGGYAARSKNK